MIQPGVFTAHFICWLSSKPKHIYNVQQRTTLWWWRDVFLLLSVIFFSVCTWPQWPLTPLPRPLSQALVQSQSPVWQIHHGTLIQLDRNMISFSSSYVVANSLGISQYSPSHCSVHWHVLLATQVPPFEQGWVQFAGAVSLWSILPCSHLSPLHPGGHVQSPKSSQDPPFRHCVSKLVLVDCVLCDIVSYLEGMWHWVVERDNNKWTVEDNRSHRHTETHYSGLNISG